MNKGTNLCLFLRMKIVTTSQALGKVWGYWQHTENWAKTESKRRRGWQGMRGLDSIIDSMDRNLSKLWQTVEDRGAWHAAVYGVLKSRSWLSHWTTKITIPQVTVKIWIDHGQMLTFSNSGWKWLQSKTQNWNYLYPHGGEGNGNPLRYSCLENPMGRGAW